MKRKLINRSKKKFTYIFGLGRFWYVMMHSQKKEMMIEANKHKYTEVLDYDNAYHLHRDMLGVPVLFVAKNKKSRIQRYINSYLAMRIKEYNEITGYNKTKEDFKTFMEI